MMYYKIRNKDKPKLYVVGTPAYLSFNKSGRVFQSIGAVRSFLTRVTKNEFADIANWEIVEYELTEKDVKPVHDVISAKTLVRLITK